MATFVATDVKPYLGPLDLTAVTERVSFGDLTADKVPFHNMAAGGHQEWKPGLIRGAMTVNLYQDHAAGVLDDTITLGTQFAFTGLPNVGNTQTAGDPVYLSRGYVGKYAPRQGAVGQAAKAGLTLPYDTKIIRGLLGHPATARTSDGNGTAVALTGPTATQSLYATLHVIAYSGFTNVVIKVQSDDSGAFGSATDRITFTTVTGLTSQFASVAGNFSTETHHRVNWDVTGSGSITFVVAFGVF